MRIGRYSCNLADHMNVHLINFFYKTYVYYAYLNSLSMLTYLKFSSALAVQHVAFQDNVTTSSLLYMRYYNSSTKF